MSRYFLMIGLSHKTAAVELREALALDEARLKTEAYPGDIFLLLTDIRLRQGSGPEVAEMIRLLRPGTPVLFMSGYAPEFVLGKGDMLPGDGFVAKPFNWADLFGRIKEAEATHAGFLRAGAVPGEA